MLPLLAPLLLPTIWIVDASGGPGANFTDLPAAVAAAQDGDTILVRSGTYSAFQTQGKALTVRGAGAASTVIVGAVVGGTLLTGVLVDGLAPDEWFDCSGLQFTMSPTLPNAGGAALLVAFGGRVRITDCIVRGGSATSVGASGLYVAQGEVHAARCTFHGGLGLAAGFGGGSNGGPAVSAFVQTLFVADRCEFFGGLGSANPAGGPVGGAALTLFQSQASLSHCTLRGGDAGTAMAGFLANPGVAIDLTGGAVVRVVGGPSDLCRAGASATNTPRPAIAAAAGSVATVHGAMPLVGSTPSAPATTGAVATNAPALPRLDLNGTPLPSGALAGNAPVLVDLDGLHPTATYVLVVALEPTLATPPTPVLGDLLVDLGSAAWIAGLLDASGHLTFSFVPITVPALLDRPVHTQGAVFEPITGRLLLSNADQHVFAL